MIILKEVKHDIATNSVEATWVKRTQPADIEVHAVDAVLDEEGNVVSPAVAAHSITPEPVDVQIKCHSYADVQMAMFRDDLAEFGSLVDEALIALVESNIKPPTPKSDKQHNDEIWAEIVSLETAQMLPRVVREVFLELPGANGKGWFDKVKKLDDDVAAQKAQLRTVTP